MSALSKEVENICITTISQVDLTKSSKENEIAMSNSLNTQITTVKQNELKKVTSIVETTPYTYKGENVTKQDISNFVKVNFTGNIATSVIKLIDKSADEIVKEQLGNFGSQLNDTEIGKKLG